MSSKRIRVMGLEMSTFANPLILQTSADKVFLSPINKIVSLVNFPRYHRYVIRCCRIRRTHHLLLLKTDIPNYYPFIRLCERVTNWDIRNWDVIRLSKNFCLFSRISTHLCALKHLFVLLLSRYYCINKVFEACMKVPQPSSGFCH